LQPFLSTKGNAVYIEVGGETLIKEEFSKDDLSTVSTGKIDTVVNQLTDSLQAQIANLQEQNRDLREELSREREHSRTQADRMTEMAADLVRLTNNAQQLHGGDMIKQLTNGGDTSQDTDIEEAAAPPMGAKKPGLFARMFGKMG
jgi:Na+/phosphate symporter